jgi:hypothetical protein
MVPPQGGGGGHPMFNQQRLTGRERLWDRSRTIRGDLGRIEWHDEQIPHAITQCLCQHPEDRVPPHKSSKSRQEAGRASTRCQPPPVGFVAQPINCSPLGFETQTKNHRGDFETQITKPELSVLWPKSENPTTLVFRLNQETHAPHLLVHGIDRTQCHLTSR